MKTDKRTFKEKVETAKFKAKVKFYEVMGFVRENPQASIMFVGAAAYLGKKGIRWAEDKRQMRLVECRHYDPRTGENWFTRRPLTSAEQLRLDKDYKSGLSKGEILQSMRLLK